MIEAPEIELPRSLTNGEIAVINLKSARERAWSLFWRDPLRAGIAESLVEQEQLTAQFVGDLTALDRLEALVRHLDRTEERSPRTVRIRAQVASMALIPVWSGWLTLCRRMIPGAFNSIRRDSDDFMGPLSSIG